MSCRIKKKECEVASNCTWTIGKGCSSLSSSPKKEVKCKLLKKLPCGTTRSCEWTKGKGCDISSPSPKRPTKKMSIPKRPSKKIASPVRVPSRASSPVRRVPSRASSPVRRVPSRASSPLRRVPSRISSPVRLSPPSPPSPKPSSPVPVLKRRNTYFYQASLAPSGRAKCFHCKGLIAKGELRISRIEDANVNYNPDWGDSVTKHFHAAHLFEKSKNARCTSNVIMHPRDLYGFGDLSATNQTTIKTLIKDMRSFWINKCKLDPKSV
jgi:hypothetical protein